MLQISAVSAQEILYGVHISYKLMHLIDNCSDLSIKQQSNKVWESWWRSQPRKIQNSIILYSSQNSVMPLKH